MIAPAGIGETVLAATHTRLELAFLVVMSVLVSAYVVVIAVRGPRALLVTPIFAVGWPGLRAWRRHRMTRVVLTDRFLVVRVGDREVRRLERASIREVALERVGGLMKVCLVTVGYRHVSLPVALSAREELSAWLGASDRVPTG